MSARVVVDGDKGRREVAGRLLELDCRRRPGGVHLRLLIAIGRIVDRAATDRVAGLPDRLIGGRLLSTFILFKADSGSARLTVSLYAT